MGYFYVKLMCRRGHSPDLTKLFLDLFFALPSRQDCSVLREHSQSSGSMIGYSCQTEGCLLGDDVLFALLEM